MSQYRPSFFAVDYLEKVLLARKPRFNFKNFEKSFEKISKIIGCANLSNYQYGKDFSHVIDLNPNSFRLTYQRIEKSFSIGAEDKDSKSQSIAKLEACALAGQNLNYVDPFITPALSSIQVAI